MSADSTFLRGDAELVYDGPSQDCCPIGGWARTFDVSPDGESILLVQQVEELVDLGVPNVPRIEMAQGWLQEVERRLGVR